MPEPPSKKQRVYSSTSQPAPSANTGPPSKKRRVCSSAAQPATTSKEILEDGTVELVNTPRHDQKQRSVCDISGRVEQPEPRRKERRLTLDWFASRTREPPEVEDCGVDELGGACSSRAGLLEWQRKWRLTKVVKDLQKLISSAWKRKGGLAEVGTHMTKADELKNIAKKLQEGPHRQILIHKLITPLYRTRCGALQATSGDSRGLYQDQNEVWIIACQALEETIVAFLASRTDIDSTTYPQLWELLSAAEDAALNSLPEMATSPEKLMQTLKETKGENGVPFGRWPSSTLAPAVDPENDDCAGESWRPMYNLDHARLTAILSRQSEVAAASRKGRKSVAVMQMMSFDKCFHTALNTPVPPSSVNLQKPQLSYAQSHSITCALFHQDAILQEMLTVQKGGELQITAETDIGRAVLHNLQFKSRTAEWIDLDSALKGPAHIAKVLIKKLQDGRSNPGRQYRLNAEQLECTALFVSALETAFARRPDTSKPWLHPAEVLMTIITDGGGGCGKTTLAVEVILPLLEAYFHPEGVLRRAPSNKPARLIGGRTMHSGQCLTSENCLRTAF